MKTDQQNLFFSKCAEELKICLPFFVGKEYPRFPVKSTLKLLLKVENMGTKGNLDIVIQGKKK